MDNDLNQIIADNIVKLRSINKITQAELAEILNYSDKSISKWERGESIPDVPTLKKICDSFNVSMDYMVTTHEGEEKSFKKESNINTKVITSTAMLGVAIIALIVFTVLWILDISAWITFVYAIVVELILLLVLHSVWENGKFNFIIIGALVLSIIIAIFFTFYVFVGANLVQLFILIPPAELIVFLASRIKKKPETK